MTKRVVPQTDRPNRVVYRLTKSGRDELDRWLATPFVRPAYRNDRSLKLLAASRLGRSRVHELVLLQREAFMGELAALSKLRRQHGDEPLVSLLIDAAILHTKADLRLLAETGADQLAQADAQQENRGSEHEAAAG